MAKPHSSNLRVDAVLRVENGNTARSVAKALGISSSSIFRWRKLYRKSGTILPKKMGGHRPRKIIGEHRRWSNKRIDQSNFTVRGLVTELADRELKVDYRTVWKFVRERRRLVRKRRSKSANSESQKQKSHGQAKIHLKTEAATATSMSSKPRR